MGVMGRHRGYQATPGDDQDLWCQFRDLFLEWLGWRHHKSVQQKIKKLPKKITCPKCGKRMKLSVQDCQDTGCAHTVLPRHKKKT